MGKNSDKICFEVPYSAQSPKLLNSDLGLNRLLLRKDHHSYQMDVTLIDTPDCRLIRSGVVLAKRKTGEKSEWYLDAPTWGPWLPTNHSEPIEGSAKLPQSYSDLVKPFRRQSNLVPVADVWSEQNEYLFLDENDNRIGKLRDTKIKITKTDSVISRFRQVTLYPEQTLNPNQIDFLVAQIQSIDGRRVDKFPTFVNYFGAPYTGGTDIPEPGQVREEMSLEELVSWVFAVRLRDLIKADLAVRSGSANDVAGVLLQLRRLNSHIGAFSGVLDTEWANGVKAMINLILESGEGPRPIDSLGESYFAVLDSLVAAVKAPRVGEYAQEPAKQVVSDQIEVLAKQVSELAKTLRPNSIDQRWIALDDLVARCRALVRLAEPLFGKEYRKLAKSLRSLRRTLKAALPKHVEPEDEEIRALTPMEAYQLGRVFQADKDEVRISRAQFVEKWPSFREKLKQLKVNGG